MRYDVQLVPGPDKPNTLNPVAFNATSQINPNLHMIQPRIGFNWNPQEGTVVRGGYGMFYGQVGNSSYYTLRRENGVYQKQYGVSALTANSPYTSCASGTACTVAYQNNGVYQTYSPQGGVPIYTPPGPAPVDIVTNQPVTIPSSINPSLGQGITIRGMDPSFTNPVSQSWDLTVEQAMPLHSSLTLGYVGNRANHLPIYIDTNVDPYVCSQQPLLRLHQPAHRSDGQCDGTHVREQAVCQHRYSGHRLLRGELLVSLHGGHRAQADGAWR